MDQRRFRACTGGGKRRPHAAWPRADHHDIVSAAVINRSILTSIFQTICCNIFSFVRRFETAVQREQQRIASRKRS